MSSSSPRGDEVLSDKDFNMIAKMHKAISIMQWKMEGQIIKRRPEFRMENRLLLDKIDFEKRNRACGWRGISHE